MPTFKFQQGRPEYVFENPKKQPSYTDRVLFRCTRNGVSQSESVAVETYDSQKIFLSDHIPLLFVARLMR